MSIIGAVFRFFLERGAKNRSYAELIEKLQRGSEEVSHRLQSAQDTPRNRDRAAHIIGIERWGQRRLRCLLGEPPLHDEYDGYRPSTEESLPALLTAFQQTRAETIELARSLQETHTDLGAKVEHNQSGPLSAGAWLVYLAGHAGRESRALR